MSDKGVKGAKRAGRGKKKKCNSGMQLATMIYLYGDCHFCVGDALGTDLQVAQYPIKSSSIISSCIAASIMFMVALAANGYFENVWAWNADHDIDGAANTQVDIYVARDFQGYEATQAPLPFEQGVLWTGDPIFDMCGSATLTCNMAWAAIVQSSENIFINGAGLYSWFQNYNEDCVNTVNCQQRLINIYNVSNLWFNHIITISSVEVVTPAISNDVNNIVYATNVTQAPEYPWWTAIAVYLDSTENPANNMPICTGFAAFGESYSSGIGAGQPYDNTNCYRGTGAYSAILNQIYTLYWSVSDPSLSDLALVNILGNDAGFKGILRSCITGYDKETPCNTILQNAQNFVADTNDFIDTSFNNILRSLVSTANEAGKNRPDQTVYPGKRFYEPNVTEPQPSNNQGSVAFFYPNGNDQLPDNFALPTPKDGAPSKWSVNGTINSATNCILETDNAGNSVYPYFWCDMAVTLAADPSAISSFEATKQTNVGDYSITTTLNADGSVTITGFSVANYLKMFYPKLFAQFDITELILSNIRVN
ncbi:hypothetical protein B7463_g10093, partial [Scytalidium lignicola]